MSDVKPMTVEEFDAIVVAALQDYVDTADRIRAALVERERLKAFLAEMGCDDVILQDENPDEE